MTHTRSSLLVCDCRQSSRGALSGESLNRSGGNTWFKRGKIPGPGVGIPTSTRS